MCLSGRCMAAGFTPVHGLARCPLVGSVLTTSASRYNAFCVGPIEDYWRVGFEMRDKHYEPLPGTADDGRFPWYQYWQVVWAVLRGSALKPGMVVLDAGGAPRCSLVCSQHGAQLSHSVDINPRLVQNARRIARRMGWPIHAELMSYRTLGLSRTVLRSRVCHGRVPVPVGTPTGGWTR